MDMNINCIQFYRFIKRFSIMINASKQNSDNLRNVQVIS